MTTATVPALDSVILEALDFTPHIPCESSQHEPDHDGVAFTVTDCGCTAPLCAPMLARALTLSAEPLGIYCPKCEADPVRIIDVRPIGASK